ncbi:hypothetical protein AB205_0155540, partial [Aquarana catesbeiana]
MEAFQGNNITVFILIGFPTRPELQFILFTVFLITYILTVAENVIIILTVKFNVKLHKPMYYLMCSLSFLEIWFVTVTVPKLLNIFLTQNTKISFVACMIQLYIFISLACTECVLLAAMAFDRCVAICFPLLIIIIYICILWTVLKLPNNMGLQKAFSTCAFHLTIVILFYTTTLFIYARPRKANPFDRNKLVTILYSILTPL